MAIRRINNIEEFFLFKFKDFIFQLVSLLLFYSTTEFDAMIYEIHKIVPIEIL